MESQKKSKTRDLSPYEYFQVLQTEWISADIRVRIYPNKRDKAYWTKVKEGKRQRIEAFAEKNHLPTIFTDEEMKRVFESKVYGESGVPHFVYKDDESKRAQRPFDLLYYYYKDAEIRFDFYGETKVGKIKSYTLDSPTVTITCNNVDLVKDINDITRIL